MARREPTGKRPRPSRSPRRTVLIVHGADRTETAYLKGLRSHFRLAAVKVKFVEKPESPDKLVEYARDTFPRDEFDEVWCVTDVDHYEREGGKVSAAVSIAADARISVAVSNPCFEFWLLLHHADCAGHCANCESVERKLKRCLPAYDKTRLRFRDFADGLDRAIARARALDPTGAEHTRNPSTGVWRLVSVLMEKE
jgi:hypothetical protein